MRQKEMNEKKRSREAQKPVPVTVTDSFFFYFSFLERLFSMLSILIFFLLLSLVWLLSLSFFPTVLCVISVDLRIVVVVFFLCLNFFLGSKKLSISFLCARNFVYLQNDVRRQEACRTFEKSGEWRSTCWGVFWTLLCGDVGYWKILTQELIKIVIGILII